MLIMDAVLDLYDKIIDKNLLVRRVYVTANHVAEETAAEETQTFEQLDLFTDYAAIEKQQQEEKRTARTGKEDSKNHALYPEKIWKKCHPQGN